MHIISALTILLLMSFSSLATEVAFTELSVEEQRLTKALQALPSVFQPLKHRVEQFDQQISKARNLTALTQLIIRHGDGLFKDAVKSFELLQNNDDRPLYWSRLQMSKILKTAPAFQSLLPMQQEKLLWLFELYSRGQKDVKFNKNANKKILLTGFDPFFLDRHIEQSNPSGVAVLALDDLLISNDGMSAEIETLMIPVRFADFDQGMIEELLAPYYRDVDMIVTVSMGRKAFDLERFPALRRSAAAPDNLNILTGASGQNPKVPLLKGKALVGPEFIEFSLPTPLMVNVQQPFAVNDNRQVTTLAKTFMPSSLAELAGHVSVSGSGGGYLSNEISYRSLLLREQLNPLLPVGHIHTPSIRAFEPQTSEKIVKQIKQMLTRAIKGI